MQRRPARLGPAERQGRGVDPRPAAPKPRKCRPAAPSEKTSKRGLYLTDAVRQRLQLAAVQHKTNVSAIAGDVLERNPVIIPAGDYR
jgi:hypothetical protein